LSTSVSSSSYNLEEFYSWAFKKCVIQIDSYNAPRYGRDLD
jgi:hypothetical protein